MPVVDRITHGPVRVPIGEICVGHFLPLIEVLARVDVLKADHLEQSEEP